MKPVIGESNPPNSIVDGAAAKEPTVVPAKTPTPSRIARWAEWIFSYEPSYLPLFVLWCIGVIWAVVEMMRSLPSLIKPEEAGVLASPLRTIVTIQLFLGFLHQFVVFRCIHVFDSERALWADRFPDFIGTRLEWILRLLILLSLLAVGGELPLLLTHIRDSYHAHLHEIPPYTYPLCSVILYGLLVAWDVSAALRRPDENKLFRRLAHLFWHGWHPPALSQIFFYSDLLCLIFWSAILSWAKEGRIGAVSVLSVILTLVFFLVVTVYRIISHVKSQSHSPVAAV